ncbi:MAG: hypothetical protein AAGE03_04330 [Pseudomonadota bacterium]
MELSSFAKAWAALVTALLSAFAQFIPLVADGGLSGPVAVVGAILTALAVYAAANRLDGWNVFDLARALLDANAKYEAEPDQ